MNTESKTAGFTLVEMLAVVTIIAILAGASVTGISRAREIARNTKAEAESRELVNAWLQHFDLYGRWPDTVAGKKKVDAGYSLLKPLTDVNHSDNPRRVVLLNLTERAGTSTYNDPWGTPYQLSFVAKSGDDGKVEHSTKLCTSISFPFKSRESRQD